MPRSYHLLIKSFLIALPIIGLKFLLHSLDWEAISLVSLHASIITGTIFVLGFILSATISDYKESERIPAEAASIIQNMYSDVVSIHDNYPGFNMPSFKRKIRRIANSLGDDFRHRNFNTQDDINNLNQIFNSMEKAGVPANFIVKLKQQQAQLLRVLLRVSYIQRIRFVPSAMILARTVAISSLVLIVFTEIEPFYGGLAIAGILSLILVYVLLLIEVIAVPFQREGKTQDDVSLFLIDQTIDKVRSTASKNA
jgi:hypothetical protein